MRRDLRQRSALNLRIANGANTTSSPADQSNTHQTELPIDPPWMSARRRVGEVRDGVDLHERLDPTGHRAGSTKTLLANVSGNSTVMLICITDFGGLHHQAEQRPHPREAEAEHEQQRDGQRDADEAAVGAEAEDDAEQDHGERRCV